MRLKRKILLFTIGILSVALLVSSMVTIRSFRTNYTDALVTGSFGVAHSIEILLNGMLASGQPLNSLPGMNLKLAEVVDKNAHITYAYVMDMQGRVLFHSQPARAGEMLNGKVDQRSLQAKEHIWQAYDGENGGRFIDVSQPLFMDDRLVGVIRLGFPDSVIEDKVMSAIKQLLINNIFTFLLITLILNIFLRRQVVEPIKRLSKYAKSIAQGVTKETVLINRGDEIGLLSGALVRMNATLKRQIEALKSGGLVLEEKVKARTRQLAQTNNILKTSNNNLTQALRRERELSEALRRSEERFRMLFEQNKAVMLIIDPQDGQIVAANKVALSYYGYSHAQLLKLKISDINTLSNNEISREMELAQQEERNHFYFHHALASGEVRDVEVHSGPITWGERSLLYSIIHDITDRKRAEAKLQHIAHYDALTGLPNRLLKTDRLRQAISHSHRSKTSVGVCYLDLDGFKPINDRYGHDIGDLILIEIARRLQATVREGDTVSRIGGDEFVLILTDLADLEQCEAILERVLVAIAQPIAIDDIVMEVCASIGLTLYPQDDADADILLRHADQAMYIAKENGKNGFHLFDPVEDRQVRAHRAKLLRLQQALQNKEFELLFQPKVNMLTCDVIGMEALIRWNHPDKGVLLPGEFLYHLENTDLEIEVGNWVIRHALEQQKVLREAGMALPVSVNINAHHLQHNDFVDDIKVMLEELPVMQPGDLEFEILETASIEDITDIYHTLINCKELGIRFSLDDFGTGYSSLAYFHRLPVDNLKIDQSFVQNMLENPQDLTIVDSVVRLASAFKHPVIAEGVESLEHGAALLRLGCHLGQGYGIARPMRIKDLLSWKRNWDSNREWQDLKYRFVRDEGIDIQAAITSHQEWVWGLAEWIRHGDEELGIQLDYRHCPFGRWFNGAGFLHYGHLPVYVKIKKLHERVHELGREMHDLANHNFKQEALARLPELEALRDRMIELIGQLQDVELSAEDTQENASSR